MSGDDERWDEESTMAETERTLWEKAKQQVRKEAAVRAALEELALAEEAYRHAHDLHGNGHIHTGRAWDQMRRAGDHARAILNPS